ncbi:dihydrolipoamide acetyltransferase family protein [Inmirania thermothiophila]|uniref:Dihydrolipoamide acetyltransferase component of pyruvate dehydrogenase complex n=1 Tax=Inmirania thermothiophila TaxID=1750597 RepID=A0A3N1Y5G9_9GAMM|nr:dihydrolipoamide acetyltransferase family protein [Inmirania thermothiophila]ROR32862.1 pyruvate dehydrogenase E2 component (dihydrolipoamide acetyltransferase) [Inmirania thermothiophila]
MQIFKLPDLGEGLAEAEIVAWHVAPGDRVVADQPLVSVETAKAIVEIPAPQSGTVVRLYAEPGDVVHVGDPLVEFGEGGREDAGAVVGEVAKAPPAAAAPPPRPAPPAARPSPAGVRATPAVRALAQRLGVDLAMVKPTGPDGMITAADVQRAARALEEAGPPEPLRGVRRAMARNMAQAHAEVAAVTVVDDADIEAWEDGQDVTLRLVRAIVAGCRAEPGLNAWYDGHAMTRRVVEAIHLAIAVDTPDGLFTPVLRDVAGRSPEDLRAALDRIKADVRTRQVPPEEMRGYTFTLSNFGTIAGRYADPVVVPPTVAILGAGRLRREVVATDEGPAIHRVLPLSLSFDHRCVTGGEAARFLRAVMDDLAKPH